MDPFRTLCTGAVFVAATEGPPASGVGGLAAAA